MFFFTVVNGQVCLSVAFKLQVCSTTVLQQMENLIHEHLPPLSITAYHQCLIPQIWRPCSPPLDISFLVFQVPFRFLPRPRITSLEFTFRPIIGQGPPNSSPAQLPSVQEVLQLFTVRTSALALVFVYQMKQSPRVLLIRYIQSYFVCSSQ